MFQLFVELAQLGLFQHGKNVFPYLFKLMMDRAGAGFRAFLQSQPAARKYLVPIYRLYHIRQAALAGGSVQVKPAIRPFYGLY